MQRESHFNGGRAARGRGFTLVELVVSTFVAAIAVLITLFLAGQMTGLLRTSHHAVTAQDNARVAIDEITRTLRGAGSGTDYTSGQDRFVYAGAFTVAINANLLPVDDPAGTGAPAALDVALANAAVPLDAGTSYTPPQTYATGAETIVLTLDSNRDGVIGAADATDDPEEDSENPDDYVLKTFVYGKSGTANNVQATGLARLRGPALSEAGTQPEPLFRYWVDTDNDPATPATLHGDANDDGRLSATEAASAGAVAAAQLPLIERIEVAASGEPEKARKNGEYPRTVLRSTVSFRNRSSTAAHVVGRVFHDLDRDGIQDANELGLRDVVLRASNNSRAKTDLEGHYSFVLSPGIYTITEVDPPSYTSTTPNAVQVNPAPGDYVTVNFGDRSTMGTGTILGTVFSDADADGERDQAERGIAGVRVYLDTGASIRTDTVGRYYFTVQTKDYIVTEEDSVGYTSTTPNVVSVNLRADGDTLEVNFADHRVTNSGTIHGIVYKDLDNDGVRDATEPGIANVLVTLDGTQAMSTDARGEFSFTAGQGTHSVTETDSPGYTSSTANTVTVSVVARQTTEIAFGDIPQQDISFQEIVLSNTERALSIQSLETGEDSRSDMDLTLGTHYVGGRNDLLTWWNNRTNSSTPNAAIFATTSSYQRVIAADVNVLAAQDLSGDGRYDVVAGLGSSTNNIAVYIMQGSGISKGMLPTSPTALYTASLATAVLDVHLGMVDSDTRPDLVVGTRTAPYAGRLEILHGTGSASFSKGSRDVYATVPGTSESFGEIIALGVADFTGDEKSDLVVGTRRSATLSRVYLLRYAPGVVADGDFALVSTFDVAGSLTDLLALDMFEDDGNDIDIVLGAETAAAAGRIEVWHNRGDNTFGMGETANATPDDSADPGGSPLSLTAGNLDNDIFPDIAVGTRSGTYMGKVVVYRGYGYLPSTPIQISTTDVGEVITATNADFNKDGAPDVAVGTRYSSTGGKVVVYFNQRPAI